MSAFVVSDKHINTLVTFAALHHVSAYCDALQRSFAVDGHEQATAQMFLAENVRSVNCRYRTEGLCPSITFDFEGCDSLVQILKAKDCLAYQCSETADWEQTPAFALLTAIQYAVIAELPGYEDASWDIE